MVRIVGTLIALALFSFPAAAQKRVALVIGNSAYQHTPKLTNPKNDAADVAAALKAHGFQVVDGFDLDKAAFERKVREFSGALRNAEVGVFFYAGHGLQVAGQNYLVPVDAKAETTDALDWEMLRLDLVHRTMERATNTNILFLDACRDNPLARNLARAMGTRSTDIGRGLAVVESGVGTLISFSTQPGNVALDGTGRNSPYAGALIKQMSSSNDDLSSILIGVRNDVMKETQRKQVPWEHSALTGRFYFGGTRPPTPSQVSEAERAWSWIKNTTDQSILENFVTQFGATPFATMARARMEELKKQQVAMAVPPKTPLTQPPAAEKPSASRCDGVETTVGSERRCLKPKDSFKDCDTCPEMVVVPAGEFVMGSPPDEAEHSRDEGPQHVVTIAKPFAVARFAVTRGEFTAFVSHASHAVDKECWIYDDYRSTHEKGRSFRNPGFSQDDQHPVVCVNWADAKAYAGWLSNRTGKGYRLPTEAEREYSTRAQTRTSFWWGSSISIAQANYDGNQTYAGGSKGEWRKGTVPVNSFHANPWGLYNTHGNIWEWVEDCWHETYEGAPKDGSDLLPGNPST